MISPSFRSLTLRLTLLISLAATLVLLGLGVLIGSSVERHFEEQDIEALNGKMQLVQHALERIQRVEDIPVLRRQLMDSLVGHHGLSLEIVGRNGTVLFSTPEAEMPFSQLQRNLVDGGNGRPVRWIAGNGTPFRGIAAIGRTGMPDMNQVVIAVATDISHHEHFMSGFRSTLWTFIVVAALAMGLFGWGAVRRGLLPLKSIRDEAAAITARRLDARLPVDTVPSELTDLVATLNDMLGRLEASFRRLSDFSSDLAHELRTPVSNLLTETQVTLGKLRTPAQYQDVLASNAEELERMSSMISDMLYLAKADNDLMIPHREVVDLAKEIASLFDYYEALAEEKQVTMTCLGNGRVQGDRLMLRRAVSNLLSNALRHTPMGGQVVVRIHAAPSGELCLEVENPGPQIESEHLPRLFDRFYRVDASRQRSSEGAGLGLAITQSIMNAHGGAVSVRSDEQRTVFALRLPVEGRN